MRDIKLLLADDDQVFCRLAGALLSEDGYGVQTATTTQQVHSLLANDEFDVIMLDLCFPALVDGFALLEQIRKDYPQLKVLMISGSGNVPNAVKAIQMGAADFIVKPIEPDHLLLRIQSLTESIILDRKLQQLEHKAIGMIGVSAAMQSVFEEIIAASKLEIPVMVTGETGVGKELASKAVHRLSMRGNLELISINCANVPTNLFSHTVSGEELEQQTRNREIYTDYLNRSRVTSVFLDEISEFPFSAQSRLLSFLASREKGLDVLGDDRFPRIISATNANMPALVDTGRFREDLYHRLNAFQIHIPPLRQRRDDIEPLSRYLQNEYCRMNSLIDKDFSPRAISWLCEQDWEGNVRQLKHCVERATILSHNSVLEPEDFVILPQQRTSQKEKLGTLRDRLQRYETKLIAQYMKSCNNNLSEAARQLGIDKSNLSKKIRLMGIDLKH